MEIRFEYKLQNLVLSSPLHNNITCIKTFIRKSSIKLEIITCIKPYIRKL